METDESNSIQAVDALTMILSVFNPRDPWANLCFGAQIFKRIPGNVIRLLNSRALTPA
jgi:hypothetical protein